MTNPLQSISETAKAVRATAEAQRLRRIRHGEDWRAWGPYLSERQWGTIREDYSADGDAWADFPFGQAMHRAYRWGEDGIAGFGDEHLRLCVSLALWNGRDRILKERLFGLDNEQGNHGEDVKENYYFLDGTPTHAYMRMLYKYPQAAFPYENLIAENAARGLDDREYELVDTGVFDDGRYFDVVIEYAKDMPDDLVMRVTATNRGDATATLHLMPQVWARNTWAWDEGRTPARLDEDQPGQVRVRVPDLAPMRVIADEDATLLFCDNETNVRKLYGVEREGFFKDALNDYVVDGDVDAVNPERFGSKVGLHQRFEVPAGGTVVVRLRLKPDDESVVTPRRAGFVDDVIAARRAEADAFYAALQVDMHDEDAKRVQRQAFAGLLWCKQFYAYDVRRWMSGDPTMPPPPEGHARIRNRDWQHLVLADVISMPDNWEYSWFASWDLAFHCIAFALIDPQFAKSQLVLLLEARSLHPNGELPAYEWDFNAVNPPVHAFAALQIHELDKRRTGRCDVDFLKRVFHKLLLNFTWWVNREDVEGRNVFQGGFMGLDNIALFDRSIPMKDGASVDQSDATAWMAIYALNMLRIAMELAVEDASYEDMATKFFEHFLYIAEAAHSIGGGTSTGLWDDVDGFYYDVLNIEGRPPVPMRVRSMVGVIPFLAVEVVHDDVLEKLPRFRARLLWFLEHRPELARLVSHWSDMNNKDYRLLSLMRRERMNRVLARLLDEAEFLSDHGIRSLSKYHQDHPVTLDQEGVTRSISYEPAEGRTRLFGGNSNWRGPVWMPFNFMIIEALHRFHAFYGESHRVPFPTGSGELHTLSEIADRLVDRVRALFVKDAQGRRAYLADSTLEQTDPHFADLLLFHEYFDGNTGRGLGASHQTGWTALVAILLHPHAKTEAQRIVRGENPQAPKPPSA